MDPNKIPSKYSHSKIFDVNNSRLSVVKRNKLSALFVSDMQTFVLYYVAISNRFCWSVCLDKKIDNWMTIIIETSRDINNIHLSKDN